MNVYQWNGRKNVGDTLTKPILEYFLDEPINLVSNRVCGKFLGVGSIINPQFLKTSDTIWGSGCHTTQLIKIPRNVNIILLRGKFTAAHIHYNCDAYGDPAILMPIIYNPDVEKKYKLGIIEHITDVGMCPDKGERIDVALNYKAFIDKMKACEFIKSSSLHGLILAEAYGIPCEHVHYKYQKTMGDFKYRDYLSATGRTQFSTPFDLKAQQRDVLRTLKAWAIKANKKLK